MLGSLRAGDVVEVLGREEILATLDADGCVERMPFMPEMLPFCGKRLRVSAIAHKTCDTAFKTGGRRLWNTVHLEELRCDGGAHGGCQATCLIFWNTAWLRRVDSAPPIRVVKAAVPSTVAALQAATSRKDSQSGKTCYSCQVTRLYGATTPQRWWDVRQYWRDVATGNVTLGRAFRVLSVAIFRAFTESGIAYRGFFWMYDRVHRALNGRPAPFGTGTIPPGQPTPDFQLNLQPGEIVRVKSHEAIKTTLNTRSHNRGLWFDHEMVQHCGREYRVTGRVHNIINEVSGEMMYMKNPCIVLDGVYCRAEYTPGRLLCRRAVTSYWREGWLERTQPPAPNGAGAEAADGPRTNAMSAQTRRR